jgi:hypothetical protein
MKRPWELAGRAHDDMESMQTDVMRFMAILGLCLAAIFSLVKSPDFNPPAELQTAIPDMPTLKPSEFTPEREVEEPAVVTANEANPNPSPAQTEETVSPSVPEQEGFILEFESAKSLASLVKRGTVTLVIADNGLYWAWSNQEGLTEVNDLSGFYVMEGHTVPDEFRRAAEAKMGPGDKTWGVVLPAGIINQIGSIVERYSGGALVISSTGVVSREKSL